MTADVNGTRLLFLGQYFDIYIQFNLTRINWNFSNENYFSFFFIFVRTQRVFNKKWRNCMKFNIICSSSTHTVLNRLLTKISIIMFIVLWMKYKELTILMEKNSNFNKPRALDWYFPFNFESCRINYLTLIKWLTHLYKKRIILSGATCMHVCVRMYDQEEFAENWFQIVLNGIIPKRIIWSTFIHNKFHILIHSTRKIEELPFLPLKITNNH